MNNGMNTMMLTVGNCCEVEGVESHRMIIDTFLCGCLKQTGADSMR